MIRAVGLTKRYGAVEAVRDLSLEVARGEILSLVGPNGAGKTTALKLLVGLLTPDAGEVWMDGYHVVRQPMEVKRLLAFVPDMPFLYEQLTVAELLGFVGSLYRLDVETSRARALELLELFGLTGHLRRRIGQLSYGMKSRVVLLASLLREPRILIMDEPFFGLDPKTLRLMKRLLRERAAGGMTIVLSTHQLSVVEDLARRIAVMHQGTLVALGTWDELKRLHGGAHLEEVFFQLTEPGPSPSHEA